LAVVAVDSVFNYLSTGVLGMGYAKVHMHVYCNNTMPAAVQHVCVQFVCMGSRQLQQMIRKQEDCCSLQRIGFECSSCSHDMELRAHYLMSNRHSGFTYMYCWLQPAAKLPTWSITAFTITTCFHNQQKVAHGCPFCSTHITVQHACIMHCACSCIQL
jgi:hypothetical protein